MEEEEVENSEVEQKPEINLSLIRILSILFVLGLYFVVFMKILFLK